MLEKRAHSWLDCISHTMTKSNSSSHKPPQSQNANATNNTLSTLLKRGQKYNYQIKSEKKLLRAHQMLFNAMNHRRVKSDGLISEAIIFLGGKEMVDEKSRNLPPQVAQFLESSCIVDSNDSKCLIRVIRQKTRHWQKMGYSLNGKLFMHPEEALLMMERGLLRLWLFQGSSNVTTTTTETNKNSEDSSSSPAGDFYVNQELELREELQLREQDLKKEKRRLIEEKKKELLERKNQENQESSSTEQTHDSTTTSTTLAAKRKSPSSSDTMSYQDFLGLKKRKKSTSEEKDAAPTKKKSSKPTKNPYTGDTPEIELMKRYCRPLYSVQDAFSFFTSQMDHATNLPLVQMQHYIVYRYLKQNGFTVKRHDPQHYAEAHSQDVIKKQQEQRQRRLMRVSMRKQYRKSVQSAQELQHSREKLVEGMHIIEEPLEQDAENQQKDMMEHDSAVEGGPASSREKQQQQHRTWTNNGLTTKMAHVPKSNKRKKQPKVSESSPINNESIQEELIRDAKTRDMLDQAQWQDTKSGQASSTLQNSTVSNPLKAPNSLVSSSKIAQLPEYSLLPKSDVREALQIVKRRTAPTLPFTLPDQWKIVYDVWRANQKLTKNKIPLPHCGVVICSFDDEAFPSMEVLHELERQCGSVPAYMATLENGVVSFSHLCVSFEMPDIL